LAHGEVAVGPGGEASCIDFIDRCDDTEILEQFGNDLGMTKICR
jgi:hypothetical protein